MEGASRSKRAARAGRVMEDSPAGHFIGKLPARLYCGGLPAPLRPLLLGSGTRPGQARRRGQRAAGGGEQSPAARAEIVFAIAGEHAALGVLHDAAGGGTMRQTE